MNTEEISNALFGIELFNELTDEQRNICAQHMEVKQFEKGEVIVEQGQNRDRLFVIQKGTISEFSTKENGTTKTINRFKRNEIFGEGSLMDNYPYSLSAKASTDCRLFVLDRQDYSRMMENHTKIMVKLIAAASRMISRRMRNFNSGDNIAMRYSTGATRKEHDMIGEKLVPEDALYGIQSLRAAENFNISAGIHDIDGGKFIKQ